MLESSLAVILSSRRPRSDCGTCCSTIRKQARKQAPHGQGADARARCRPGRTPRSNNHSPVTGAAYSLGPRLVSIQGRR